MPEIKTCLLDRLSSVEFSITLTVKDSTTYKRLMEIPDKDLPLVITKYPEGSCEHFILDCRLSGKDPFETNLSKCLELLYDEEFDMEDYNKVGYNDGVLSTLSELFTQLDMTEESKRATSLIYGE